MTIPDASVSKLSLKWYQLHMMTWITVILTVSSVLALNFDGASNLLERHASLRIFYSQIAISSHGWPAEFGHRESSGTDENGHWYSNRWAIEDVPIEDFHVSRFLLDLGIGVSIILGSISHHRELV